MVDDRLYRRWLDYVFDRPDEKAHWYYDPDVDFVTDDETLVDFASAAFRNARCDLSSYSNLQVTRGLSAIFYNHGPNVAYAICQKGVAEDKRIDAVRDMTVLYRDCFAVRCAPVLSHLDEAGANPLNGLCYMLWDESPLCQWKSVVLDVMESALYLPNPACVESALHGLNHRWYQSKTDVEAIVDRFLARSNGVRPELRRYALQARSGRAL